MRIDWILGLGGGMLIGLAAALLLATLGRIAGVSGIVGGLLTPERGAIAWRVAFVTGLLLAGAGRLLAPEHYSMEGTPGLPWLVLAGLLVGFGTRLGAGCTSGHGVCGLGRGSPRSFAATLTFIAAGALVVLIRRSIG